MLEAARQTVLREAEVVLHSEEVWMYCPKLSKKEQLNKDTDAVAAPSWLGVGERSGETEMPVCAKLTDSSKERLHLRLKKGNHDLKGLRVTDQDGSNENEEIELRQPNPPSISTASKKIHPMNPSSQHCM